MDSTISDILQYDGNISFDDYSLPVNPTTHGVFSIPVQISERIPKVQCAERISVRKVIKRNNLLLQAIDVPSIMNINPRSVYNKVNEFLTLVEQYESDIIFMSETWDRPLENLIQIDDFNVITAVNPRNFKGGKPALIINEDKYIIRPLNPDPITVPDGVEAVWALLTPKDAKPNNQLNHIAVASIYYRGPKSTRKDALFDHIAESYHFLMAKYGAGLHFIIAGDTNRLNLSPILNLSPSLKQVVTVPTRLNPDVTLDPVITTMSKFFQLPITKPPLENDQDKQGKPSDHLVVLMYPINSQIGVPPRKTRLVTFRPLPQSGIDKMGRWIQTQSWLEIYQCPDVSQKAEVLQNLMKQKLDECLPTKTIKISSTDKPWVNQQVKDLDRKCKREFYKHKKSQKWKNLKEKFVEKCKKAKESYYKNTVEDLKESNQSQWYSKIKRMGGLAVNQGSNIQVDELEGMPIPDQAERIAQHYAKVSNEYKALRKDDIPNHLYNTEDLPPVIEPYQMYKKIMKMNTKKASVKDDIPMSIIKEFAAELADPLAHILNSGLAEGQYPEIWKFEMITPVPKVYPPESVKQLRKISGLKNFAKISDSFLAEFITDDMQPTRDAAQYGNQKGLSTQHYLVRMIHQILTATDKNSKNEAKAVIAQMIDWEAAFDRQCHKLGILSFINNGVRKPLIPILISYFQNRQMSVKWNGYQTKPYPLPGGGVQGGQLGQIEYLSQSNENVSFLTIEEKFKFIDDLSTLEMINLVFSGISSYNFKEHVASDIGVHGKYLPNQNFQSQKYLEKISSWTNQNQMALNKAKTKYMVINYTKNFQFNTRIYLENTLLEEVQECQLLGLTLTNDLSWYKNTQKIVKKANVRMIIIHKLYEFNLPVEEMITIYILFIRSMVEYACVVWHSSITEEEITDIERVQKTALRIILREDYMDYNSALATTGLDSLKDRRTQLCVTFAKKCVKSEQNRHLFPLNPKLVNTRPHEKLFVTHARTDRLAKSAVPYLQRLLNTE